MKTILLDTHAAMWSVDALLPRQAQAAVDLAAANNELLISPITAWEIGMLVSKKRLQLEVSTDEYVRRLFGAPSLLVANLTAEIAVASTLLPGTFHADPADRFLIATAAAYGAELMTRDKKIHDYAKKTRHIRCIAC